MTKKRHKSSCHHDIDEGITASKKGTTRDCKPCSDYGTYCAQCVLEYYKEGILENQELIDLIELVQKETRNKYE